MWATKTWLILIQATEVRKLRVAINEEQRKSVRPMSNVAFSQSLLHEQHVSVIQVLLRKTALLVGPPLLLNVDFPLFFFGGLGREGRVARFALADKRPRGNAETDDQRRRDGADGGEGQLVSPDQLLKPVGGARRARDDWLVFQVAFNICRE